MSAIYNNLDRIRREMEKARDKLTELCSIGPRGMRYDLAGPQHGGGLSDPVGERAAAIVEQRETYEELIGKYLETMRAFDSLLDDLRARGVLSVMECVVLSYRHCDGLAPEQIAKEIYKSERYVYLQLASGHKKLNGAENPAARDPPGQLTGNDEQKEGEANEV